MVEVFAPRVLIAGLGAGVGKSLITTGISVALRKRGLSLACCQVGTNLVQSVVYQRVTKRYTRCLDRRFISRTTIPGALHQASLGSDLVLIDGHGDFVDGNTIGTLSHSDAEIASISGTPVSIVIASKHLSNKVAALWHGFLALTPGLVLSGAIINEADSESAELYQALDRGFRMPPLFGSLPHLLGNMRLPAEGASEAEPLASLPMQFFIELGQVAEQHLDLSALIKAAESARVLDIPQELSTPRPKRVRIAVADDNCFNILFQDNLDILRFFGAELVPFSAIADSRLPERVSGLYVPGGCLKAYGADLANNSSLRKSIRDFANRGGVIYSEGAGTAFLCETFQPESGGERLQGVGVIPGNARTYTEQASYVEAVTVEESILGPKGQVVKGFGLQSWQLETEERQLFPVMRASFEGATPVTEAFSPSSQVVASSTFFHFGSNPTLAFSLLESCLASGSKS